MNTKYTTLHFYILLAHIIRSPSVANAAFRELKAAYFTDPQIGGGIEHSVIFAVLQDYHKRYGTAPDLVALQAETDRALQQIFPQWNARVADVRAKITTFIGFVHKVDDKSVKLANDVLQHLLSVCLFEPAKREIVQAMPPDLVNKLVALEARAKSTLGQASTHNVLDCVISDLGGQRIPSGIPFLDAMVGQGAGLVTGSAVGLIAPQSAGKTTTGVMLAVAQALMNRPSVLAFVEEGLTESVQRNIMAATTGISTVLLEKVGGNLDEAIKLAGLNREQVMLRKAAVNANLHVLDLVKEKTGWAGIQNEVDRLCQMGKAPSYTYIDYAEVLATQELQLRGKVPDKDLMFAQLGQISHDVTNLASRTNSLVCISQQMQPELTKKGVSFVYDEYSGKGNRGFTGPFKYVITLSPQCPRTLVQVLRLAKSRNDARHQKCLIRIDGPNARLMDVSSDYQLTGKRVVETGKQGLNGAVPS